MSTAPQTQSAAPAARSRPLGKTLLLLTRTLHIYATMFALILLVFFSFTGFILNHSDFFGLGKPTFTSDRSADIPLTLLAGNDAHLVTEQYLRKNLGARGELTTPVDEDEQTTRFQFNGPGRKIEFAVTRATGHADIHEEHNALVMLTDLHMAQHTGAAWPFVVDATAIFLFFASLSGLILWITLPKRRTLGLLALTLSLAACLTIYLLLVP